jgi:hypothetical protein
VTTSFTYEKRLLYLNPERRPAVKGPRTGEVIEVNGIAVMTKIVDGEHRPLLVPDQWESDDGVVTMPCPEDIDAIPLTHPVFSA